jgi:hypothetical protein
LIAFLLPFPLLSPENSLVDVLTSFFIIIAMCFLFNY